jgi:hypothetical protein
MYHFCINKELYIDIIYDTNDEKLKKTDAKLKWKSTTSTQATPVLISSVSVMTRIRDGLKTTPTLSPTPRLFLKEAST